MLTTITTCWYCLCSIKLVIFIKYPTCIQTLFQFLDLIGRARFPVDAFCVEAMHLDIVNEFLYHQRYRSVILGQTGDVYTKLP